MSDQNENVINLGQKRAEQEKLNTAAKAINNPDVPENYLKQIIDDEYQPMTDTVKLPSKGIFYANKQSAVKIKHLNTEGEDILTSLELIKNGKVLDVLLDNSIIDSTLSSDDMISGDRYAVLMYLRQTGYGDDYEVKLKCPECFENFKSMVKISEIQSKDLEVTPDEKGEFSTTLPSTGWEIKFRILTGRDDAQLAQMSSKGKKGKKGVSYSTAVSDKFLLQIMEVNGDRDKTKIKKAISGMPAIDSMTLREYMAKVEPGIILEANYTCTHCSHNFDGDIPITTKLFWPNSKV